MWYFIACQITVEFHLAPQLSCCFMAWLPLTRFQVFTVMKIHVTGLWVMMSHTDVVGYQCFRGPCCICLQDEVMMKAAWSSEMLVSYYITRQYHNLKNVTSLLFVGHTYIVTQVGPCRGDLRLCSMNSLEIHRN